MSSVSEDREAQPSTPVGHLASPLESIPDYTVRHIEDDVARLIASSTDETSKTSSGIYHEVEREFDRLSDTFSVIKHDFNRFNEVFASFPLSSETRPSELDGPQDDCVSALASLSLDGAADGHLKAVAQSFREELKDDLASRKDGPFAPNPEEPEGTIYHNLWRLRQGATDSEIEEIQRWEELVTSLYLKLQDLYGAHSTLKKSVADFIIESLCEREPCSSM